MVIEVAGDVPPLLELRSPQVHFGASLHRSDERICIQDLWRIIVDKPYGIIRIILVVEGQVHIDAVDMLIIDWGQALGLCGTDDESWGLTELAEVAEGVILIIDVKLPVEWQETATLEQQLGSARH